MPVPVIYPKVSLEESTGRIARWLVTEGEVVVAGQVIFEIENDKAAVEVEAPAAGVMHALAAEGATVDVGAEVALVLLPGEVPAPALQTPAAPPAHQARIAEVVQARAARAPNPTPLARRIARENAITLDGIGGTGPGGRVQKKDVLARLAALAATPADTPQGAGGALNVVWLRQGAGRPVVLLHGFGADLNNWRGFLAGTRTDWPVLALDLPAHGASPRDTPADLEDVAARIEATLAAQGVGACVLAGHSLGGAAAARIAARGRLDVGGLCLFAPAGLGPEINHSFVEGFLRARQPGSLRPWLDLLVHDPATISDAFVKAVTEARKDAALTQAMADLAARLFADGTPNFGIRADLAALSVPVKVVFGRQDRILPFHATRSLPANVALHAVDGCGHMPHLEHPALALRLLAEVARSSS